MSVQQQTPTADEAAAAVSAVAAQHQASQALLAAATLSAIFAVWDQVDPLNWIASWFRAGLGTRVFVLLAMAQETVAGESSDFVQQAYEALGHPIQRPTVVGSSFAGIASDGRTLEGLLAGAPIVALERARRGGTVPQQRDAGRLFLKQVVETQIPDAGRAADQVAIATAVPRQRIGEPTPKKVQYGWVRMLNPPSCSRCVVLAGRFYRWNAGFQRHPMCDCRHIPAIEAVADELTTDPQAYFDSLSEDEQNQQFGLAGAAAIRNGADISRVINATTRFNPRTGKTALLTDPTTGRQYTTDSTTKRGAGRRNPGQLRPTPWQIFRDARGNRDEARRLLRQFGYILG